MQRISEIELLPVREARAGEPDAWAALLARYRLPLYSYVFELIRDEQTSMDIVQEAFIGAARHIGELHEDAKFGSWLFNIAHQKCAQHWRRRKPVEIAFELQDEDFPEESDDPREILIRREQEVIFLKLLEQLPLPHRAVLLLHLIEDFPIEEIARITGAPIGTVKSRLHYARKAMRKLIEDNRT